MNSLQHEILEQLGLQFSLALEGMLGEKWPPSLKELAVPSAEDSLCWTQRMNLAPEPLLQIATRHTSWRDVGARALAAVGIDDPAENDIRATYLELLTQALSGLARFLSAKGGNEVTLEAGEEVPLPAAPVASPFHGLRFGAPTGAPLELFVRIEPALLQAFLPSTTPDPGERKESAPQVAAAAAGASSSATAAGAATTAPSSPTMDLLLDVQMPVSVSFGRTQLQLKEVIKLSTGSIIELNRTVNEPVDVIVNNCVIARGEVVVIEGNYGVRIQQIVSRAERLRSFD